MNKTVTLTDSIIGTLARRGIKRMFGVPGGGSSLNLIDSAARHGIEFVLCRTETAAAIMAAVTGELTGVPGIVLSGIGPGAASVVNGIAYASLERAPVILFTDTPHQSATAPPHQIFNQRALFNPISKDQIHLEPESGARDFERLINLAAAEPPGPVHIDLSAEDAAAEVSLTTVAKLPHTESVDTEALTLAARLLQGAHMPILIVGHQCRTADRAASTNLLVDGLGAPVMTTYKAKGVVPESDPRYVGHFTGAKLEHTVLAESDLIVFCGVDPVEIIPGKWTHTAPVVVLSETGGLAWPFDAEAEVAGSVKKSASILAGNITESHWTGDAIARHRARIRQTLANNATARRSPDEIVDAVSAAAPDNARLTVDAGAHMFSVMARWPANLPYDVLKSNGLSSMGFAVPAALASWLEEPDRATIALTGDGGMMMCLAELSTAARLGANLTVVVMNDAALSLIDIKQQRQQRPPLGVRYPKADFAAAARGMGCHAWTVGAQDPLEFAIDEAFETSGPTLVDVSVDPSGYRDQLIALRG
ncbi:MAG: thiamine pyrophosphate-binding protein [Pseudomonadota bacterium]|nr:thiamine pyrophosphate-binding protein [Pseudomonadota bacterium]